MVAELIQYIEVYPAVKEDGITNQRVTIHYNCIGAFEVPDRRKIPERDILLETRKGRVAESNFCGTPFLQTNQEKNGNIASKAAT